MPQTIRVHRDIDVGFQAAELMKEGYYGEEFQLFGFAYRQQGRVQCLISADENAVYDELVRFMNRGIVTSSVMNYVRRLKFDKEDQPKVEQNLQEEFKQLILQTFPVTWFELLAVFTEIPTQTNALPLLEQYRALLPADASNLQKQAFCGLVRMAEFTKNLDTDNARNLQYDFEEIELKRADMALGRTFFGFAYLEKGKAWQYYTNAYWPNIVSKKIQTAKQQVLSTPILTETLLFENGSYNIGHLMNDFETLLKQTFDKEYLALVEKLHLLPPTIDGAAFKQKVANISNELSGPAKEALEAYAFLWHISL